ncbi:hypothetical protein T310_5656 [Rasamsonia emersonii CBS 393.64]|uniref:F-box domain-containing protein n=1 Tax=Rasamsonia emersonii (strain ATCC 16479 / CBS 393.64 / IMI 116815) TaxID=1408163 RepID=A0A0F4YR52_RASE3|nr:hypothetical protein T310_5656 [Rasamsonia emersonii CBS 393.64]KKA20321.1 hypothetical protein T310_5656 [Rasamsonia emersonii CBS 393.64]
MLASLPPELLYVILDHLSLDALLPLRVASKVFLHLTNPRVFSEISINLSTRGFHRKLELIKSISTSSCTFTFCITTLKIRSLHLGRQYRRELDQESLQAFLSEHLPSSIRKLQNLETVQHIGEQEIAPAVGASPGLALLRIFNGWFDTAEDRVSLQSALGKARPELMELELERVALPVTGLRETLKETLSRKLQHLAVSTTPGARDDDFAWDTLWSALMETHVKLSSLTVAGSENAMDEMFAYLLSYTGLRKLKICGLQMDQQDLEESTGRRFWDQVVPHHKNSLTLLTVTPIYESVWCYGPVAEAALLQCSSLRDLTLCVCNVDSSWAEAKLARARENNKVEFRDLEVPDGARANCGAAKAVTGREDDILLFDYVIDPDQPFPFLTRIEKVLLGMRAPAEASMNWPQFMQYRLFVKSQDPKENGIWRYRIRRFARESVSEDEND